MPNNWGVGINGGLDNSQELNKWGVENISYIYTTGLTITSKVDTLSIIKCNGFSFLVHI